VGVTGSYELRAERTTRAQSRVHGEERKAKKRGGALGDRKGQGGTMSVQG